MAAVAIGFWLVLVQIYAVPRRTIGYGAISFALGAWLIKGVLYQSLVVPVLHKRLKPLALATSQGLVSGFSELFAAAVFFAILPRMTPLEVIGFGAGAGIVEALALSVMTIGGMNPLQGTPLEIPKEEIWDAFGATTLRASLYPILERALCIGIHIGTRALVYISVTTLQPIPAIVALVLFSAGDGVAYYGYLRRWKFLEPRIALPFYGFIAILAATSTLAYVVWLAI